MKRRLLWFYASVASISLIGAEAVLAAQDPAFAKANEDYAAGNFQQAVDDYQGLVPSGKTSVPLFYDLGNAHFRLGNFGEAILNYERALALDPHHPETTANLRVVRDEARALELRKTWVDRYVAVATPTQYAIVASIAWWAALFVITRLFFARRRSGGPIALAIFSVVIFAAAVCALYSLETGSNGKMLAIVTGKNVEARLATADNANSVLALPPGSEIRILNERGDWIYAALPNDLRGWIPAKSAERVRLDSPPS